MTKRFLITIGIMGALSVIFGALGTHVLSDNISAKNMDIFNIANQYLMFHALALLALTFMNRYVSRSYLNTIYYFFVIGIVLFSGSLIISSLKELTGLNPQSLNIFTSFGGILLLLGWLTMILSGISYKHNKSRH